MEVAQFENISLGHPTNPALFSWARDLACTGKQRFFGCVDIRKLRMTFHKF
jgi:hypothetical protein